jgi:hypothetical protein
MIFLLLKLANNVMRISEAGGFHHKCVEGELFKLYIIFNIINFEMSFLIFVILLNLFYFLHDLSHFISTF